MAAHSAAFAAVQVDYRSILHQMDGIKAAKLLASATAGAESWVYCGFFSAEKFAYLSASLCANLRFFFFLQHQMQVGCIHVAVCHRLCLRQPNQRGGNGGLAGAAFSTEQKDSFHRQPPIVFRMAANRSLCCGKRSAAISFCASCSASFASYGMVSSTVSRSSGSYG